MWVKATAYIELRERVAAQAATVEWMRQRINQLERRNSLLEARVGIPPVDVMQIESAEPTVSKNVLNTGLTHAHTNPESPSMQDIFHGNVNYEDMGDDAAQKAGVDWDSRTRQLVNR